MPSPARLRLAGLYLVVIGVWGTTWIAIKASVDSIPPLTASGLRFAVAFSLLALIVARTPGVPLRYPRGQGRMLALVTLAYFAAPYALMNLGGRAIPSGLAAVLFATVSIFILALSVPLLAHQTGIGGDADPPGVLAPLAAAGLHALVYVLLKRDATAISPLTLNALPMGLAGLLLGATGLAVEHPDPTVFSGASLALLGLVLASSLVALTGRRGPHARSAPRPAARPALSGS